ncbi:MAG: helix-turn-helix domain-containing protein [Bacillota bacterium]|nr:helix-turn-helix domain-containing protein [Bacillota bacterium]
MSRLGEKIKGLRDEAGMSQKALAKKLGVSESFINEVETGRKVVNEGVIDRLSKIFNKDINDITMSVEVESAESTETMEELFGSRTNAPAAKKSTGAAPKKPEVVNDAWSGALASVLKSIPVYDYSLTSILSTRLMPLQNNKIEGFPQDKVFYLEVMDDEMAGFRIIKGDLALSHYASEPVNNGICLVEYNGGRAVRQIKKLDNGKLLLISNRGSVRTETVGVKEIKIIAKLERVEFTL